MARLNKLQSALCLQMLLILAFATSSASADKTFLTTASSSRLLRTFGFQPMGSNLGEDNTPIVQVKINGSVSGTFTFDTGASISIISDKIAAELKMKGQQITVRNKTYIFDGKPTDTTVLDIVNFGGFDLKNALVLILPERRIAQGSKHLDGIIGIDMIKYYEYLFDFHQHKITMYSPVRLVSPADDVPAGTPSKYVAEGLAPGEISALGFADAQLIPLTGSDKDERKYVQALCINHGKQGEENLVLDTGATTSIISSTLAIHLGLKPFAENVLSYGIPGIEYISTAPIERFQVGDLVLPDQHIDYSSQRAFDKNLPSSLGMNILSKYDVLMDFSNNKLYLKPPATAKAPPTITIQPTPPTAPAK